MWHAAIYLIRVCAVSFHFINFLDSKKIIKKKKLIKIKIKKKKKKKKKLLYLFMMIEVDGKVALRFASAYGFRNIQNIIRKIKQGSKHS